MKSIFFTHPSIDYLYGNQKIKDIVSDYIDRVGKGKLLDLSFPLLDMIDDAFAFGDELETRSFFRGISLNNINIVQNSDEQSVLNPFTYSLIHDHDYTKSVASELLGFECSYYYIEIPYDVYEEAINELYDGSEPQMDAFIGDSETYKLTNEMFSDIVQKLNMEGIPYDGIGTTVH